jgi:hypothetical protein
MHADDLRLKGVYIRQAILDCDEGGRKASLLGSFCQESSGERVIDQN